MFSKSKEIQYLKDEIARLEGNLMQLTQGNFNIKNPRHQLIDIDVGTKSKLFLMDSHIEKLANTINDAQKRLLSAQSVAVKVNSSAKQVASQANQISQASLTLSQGAEEQANSIEKVTATMVQVSSWIKQNDLNANDANKLSLTAKKDAVKEFDHIKEMQQVMLDINKSSSNISKIITVIDDIAFQTNILALNAAVEAAKADQYGKGFAVIAEEIRNLTQMSASAAKETTIKVEGFIEKVKEGTKIVDSTASALNEIVDSITKTAVLVGSIASASNEQATAIIQVNQAVDQVSRVIRSNLATAIKSASSSEELSSQADTLKQIVNKFELKEIQMNSNLGFERLSPEVLKELEEMLDNNKADSGLVKDEKESQSTSKSKIKINLEKADFGNY